MPSSISDFRKQDATRAIALLLALVLTFIGMVEGVTRIGFYRINHVWRRIRVDERAAVTLR
jgi:hypothetical protein